MVERHQEEHVVGRQQFQQKAGNRAAGVANAFPEHAVAHVEQQAQCDRDALMRELGDFLELAVLVYRERLAGKPVTSRPSPSRTVTVTAVTSTLDRNVRGARTGGGPCAAVSAVTHSAIATAYACAR